jgi:signal transduction histidine kinase
MIAELESKGVAVQFENDPPSVPVLLDPPRMQRVFRSLLRNALEAMPLGGVVSLRFTLKEKRIITEIEDTGPGIAPEIIRNLFEPFASHGKGDSPGLGLSIARRIIEDHHGRIWADHKRGHGAIFIFSIPRPE